MMKPDHHHALQLAKQGDWEGAHAIVEAYQDPMSCWIHAYLHRVEGDLSNANYWYRQAQQVMPPHSCEEELSQLIARLNAPRSGL